MAGETGETGKRVADAKKAIIRAEKKPIIAKPPVVGSAPVGPAPAVAKPPETAPAAPKEESKPGLIDFVMQPFKDWYEFIKTNYKPFYLKLLKINVLTLVASYIMLFGIGVIALLIVLGFTGFDSLSKPMQMIGIISNLPALAILGIFLLIAFVLEAWIEDTIRLTSVVYTDSQFEKKPFSIRAAFSANIWKVLRYAIARIVISFIILLPVIVMAALIILGGAAALSGVGKGSASTGAALGFLGAIFAFLILYIIAIFYLIIAFLLFGFFSQFWTYGFLLGGMGVIDSLKRSFSITKRKIVEAFVFDIAWYVVVIMFSVPLILVAFVLGLIRNVIQNVAFSSGGLTYWGFYIVFTVFTAFVTVFLSTLVQIFSLPTSYLFWKKMKDA